MPIHRGPRLDDIISRLVGIAQPIRANIYQTWPNLATPSGLTSGASSETYGSWVEMVSAANAPNEPFTIAYMTHFSSEGRNMTFQVGIGASGSEVPVTTFACNAYGYDAGFGISHPTVFPYIPGGTRVAIRMRSDYSGSISTTGGPRIVTCRLPKVKDSYSILRLANKIAPYNYYAGDGPPMPTGNGGQSAAWTYNSYIQILDTSQTTPFIITGYTVTANVSPAGHTYMQIGLGYGGAGSETTFAELAVDAIDLYSTASYKANENIPFPFPLIVPPATRLANKIATDLGYNGSSGAYLWFARFQTLAAGYFV